MLISRRRVLAPAALQPAPRSAAFGHRRLALWNGAQAAAKIVTFPLIFWSDPRLPRRPNGGHFAGTVENGGVPNSAACPHPSESLSDSCSLGFESRDSLNVAMLTGAIGHLRAMSYVASFGCMTCLHRIRRYSAAGRSPCVTTKRPWSRSSDFIVTDRRRSTRIAYGTEHRR
jgi:hypothetical protein